MPKPQPGQTPQSRQKRNRNLTLLHTMNRRIESKTPRNFFNIKAKNGTLYAVLSYIKCSLCNYKFLSNHSATSAQSSFIKISAFASIYVEDLFITAVVSPSKYSQSPAAGYTTSDVPMTISISAWLNALTALFKSLLFSISP